METEVEAVAAGWFADPVGRHEQRWWDGRAWTARVADDGRTSPDPLDEVPAPPSGIQDEPTTDSTAEDEDAEVSHEVSTRTAAAGKAGRAGERAPRRSPKWESQAHEAIREALRHFRKPLSDLVKRDANEGDTRLLVTDFLCEALGYDKFNELTTEFMVRGEFADYGIRIDKQLVAFVEVKRAAQKLNQRHLRQVETYAVKEGLAWCFLTNGQVWQAYHVSAATGQRVETTLIFEVDLLDDEAPVKKTAKLFHLHRSALKRTTIEAVWQRRAATAPEALVPYLLSEEVVDALRKAIRKNTDYNPEVEDLELSLRAGVIRPELL